MTSSSPSIRWHSRADLSWVASDDRVVILDPDRLAAPATILEGSAAAIWWALDPPGTTLEVVAAVAAAYDLAPEAVHDEVAEFLHRLAARGLVVEVPGGGT